MQSIIMLDDVNMPTPDEVGTQSTVELLRQLVEYRGFYDRVTGVWRGVEDTSLVCAAAPAGGGRHVLSPRFTRHMNALCMPAPTHRTLGAIMTAILQVRRATWFLLSTVPSPLLHLSGPACSSFADGLCCEAPLGEHCMDAVLVRWWRARATNLVVAALAVVCRVQGFLAPVPGEVKSVCPSLVSCTIDVYQRVLAELLPTPSKFHYTFNQRDVIRVLQGLMTITPMKCTNSDAVTRLWAHEVMRVFQDRLVTVEDNAWFVAMLADTLTRSFRLTTSLEPVRVACMRCSH